jgi:6-phosphogluconolactonase
MAQESGTQRLFIGTTNPRPGEGEGRGIFAAFFKDGVLSAPQMIAEGVSPSFLASRTGTSTPLYTVLGGDFGNAVAISYATAADDETVPQMLSLLSQADCGSPGGCHLSLSDDGHILLSANYTGASVASFLVGDGGAISVASVMDVPPIAVGTHHRQEAPHPHCAYIAPGGKFVLVNDLGLDRIHVYTLDTATGKLGPHTPGHWDAAPCSGPRHILIHPNGKWIYNINELNSTIDQLAWDAALGTLSTIRTVSTVPSGVDTGKLQACEMIFSQDLRFLYASNRVRQSFVVYTVDAATGALDMIQELPNPGRESRHIAFDASGDWFLSANQFSGDISVFPVDASTGLLSPRTSYVELDGPSCLLFS